MIAPEDLIAFHSGTLASSKRGDVEAELATDAAARAQLADQQLMDQLLRAHLGGRSADERVKRSVLAVIRGATPEQLRTDVLADTLQKRPDAIRGAAGGETRQGLWGWLMQVLHSSFHGIPAPALGLAVLLIVAVPLGLLWNSRDRLQPEIGTFSTVLGLPTVRQSDATDPRAAAQAVPVRFGDRIETGDADQAEIQFRDGTTLRLAFNTAIAIPPPSSGPKSPTPNQTSTWPRPPLIHLLHGQVWTKVQKVTNGVPSAYAVRTLTATAVARGTEFGLKLRRATPLTAAGGGQSPNTNFTTILTVKEGTVEFFNSFGSVQATAMTESTADDRSRPTEPRRLQTLETARSDDGSTHLLVTAALNPWEAGEKLAGGGGYAGLHVHTVVRSNAAAANPAGLLVRQVRPASPAAGAGLRVGDVLETMDGQPLTNAYQFSRAVRFSPGRTVALDLRRESQAQRVVLPIGRATNDVPGLVVSAEEMGQLAALMQTWLGSGKAAEPQRVAQLSREIRSQPLRAAALNNLGAFYELGEEFGPAIRAYGQAVYLEPNAALYRHNLGLALRKIGSLDRALEELASAYRLAAESVSVQQSYAEILSVIGHHDEALRLTETALQAAPQHHGLWELKARLTSGAAATDAARKAVDSEPGCPVARGYLGGALLREGKLAEAEESYRKAVELAPFDPMYHMNLGLVLERRGHAQEAEAALRKAAELRPGFVLAQVNLASVLGDYGKWADAKAALDKAGQSDPESVLVARELGRLAMKQDQFEEAERHFRKALASSPYDLETYLELGLLQRHSGRPTEAEQTCLKAIELDAKDTRASEQLADLYRDELRQPSKAEELYRKCIAIAPARTEAYSGLAHLMARRGNMPEAELLLRKAVEITPASPGINNDLGELLRAAGKLDEAEQCYRKALELEPRDPSPYNNLAIIYANRGNFPEAEKMLRILVDRAKVDRRLRPVNFLINLAMVCGRQGKLDEAEKSYRQALAHDPNDAATMNGLAWFLADHQLKLEEALALARKAVQSDPKDFNYLDTLGWVLFQRGELDEAERTFKQALELAGNQPVAAEIREHLEKVTEKRKAPGQHPAARP